MSLALTVPGVVYSDMVEEWLGYTGSAASPYRTTFLKKRLMSSGFDRSRRPFPSQLAGIAA